ncbi:MAG: hypothetical protein COV67_01900 [Nitrospinae bacterium CG11_big_fil_rev_8_21_14_0_20_56_8]|nr:MAG: hypothetical protein COV67_01900 [Nitrospinae bacterium CG11_big_fil_rev_8_21_14_0_20_56_8]
MLRSTPISLACGACAVVVGLLAIFGWYGNFVKLFQWVPGTAPMQFNTALGFVGGGAALLCANGNRIWGQRLWAAVPAVFAGVSLLEYLWPIDPGIDRWFIEPYVLDQVAHPGRMAPNAAVAFLLTAGALGSARGGGDLRLWITGILGSLSLSLGMVALGGYLIGLKSAYAWGSMTSLSVNTAAGFIVLNIGVIRLAWENTVETGAGGPRWSSVLVGLVGMSATLLTWQAVRASEEISIEDKVRLKTVSLKKDFENFLGSQGLALQRMGKRIDFRPGMSHREWENDALNYIRNHPEYLAIEWLGPDGQVKGLVPEEEAAVLRDPALASAPGFWESVKKESRRDGIGVFSTVPFTGGEKGFLIAIPLIGEPREGFIVGFFEYPRLFGNFMGGARGEDLGFALYDGGKIVYERSTGREAGEDLPFYRARIDYPNTDWEILARPTPGWLEKNGSYTALWVLGLGTVLTLLLAWALHMEMKARVLALQVRTINLQLGKDLEARLKVEEKLRRSLAEKDILLQELHHRAKNNMQVISSLLRLQSKSSRDSLVQSMFRQSSSRIRAMALAHEMLYQGANLAEVDFGEYARSLACELLNFHGVPGDQIRIEVHSGGGVADLDSCMYLGLILNELLTNCLRHAFPDGRKGRIGIHFDTSREALCHLTVKDDGVGIGPIDIQRIPSLGLKLVRVLVEEQMDGTMELIREPHTEFRIAFPKIRNAVEEENFPI